MTRLVVGTAGHIDHGKSALVTALTGTDPDRLEQEKARGISIELGFAHAVIGDTTLAFVDVPGHERFVRTMLAGAGGIDCVLLIVAADESVMPQTREHFEICRLLGIPQGLVVLTKIDLVDAETRALVALEVADLVHGSFLDGAPVLGVSAVTGSGLDALRDALVAAAARAQGRPWSGVARMPIDRVFSVHGFGTVATGTLVSGVVAAGDEVVLQPSGRSARVRGLQVHGVTEARAAAGQRVAVNLGGIDAADIVRGETLTTAGSLVVTTRLDVEVEVLPDAKPIRHGARVRVHQGTAERLARVSVAGAGPALDAGARSLARVRLEAPGVFTRGDRLILRAYSPPRTIAAATVLDPAPVSPGIRTPAAWARLERLRAADGPAALVAMVEGRGLAGMPVTEAVSRAGLAPSEVDSVVRRLVEASLLVRAGGRLMAPAAMARAAEVLLALVAEAHRREPLSDGLPREEARERLGRGVDDAVFDEVVRGLAARGALVDRERLALPQHRAASAIDEAAVARVEQAYLAAHLVPPDAASVAAQAGVPAALAAAATALLVRQKTLVKLDGLVFHREAIEALKRDLRAMKDHAPEGPVRIDVAAFKERYGVTRKFAIPLLEYLDRERVTRRVGDGRVLV